ncbi:MAG: RCC1 repeat-containing protein, partial [Chloroflexi bacterium]|nr:RCC1 repeat-containing protein [Chloroflexota bacterium]
MSQRLTLAVNEAAVITSIAAARLTLGRLGAFPVTTWGYPLPTLTQTGTLPGGVAFTDNGNGTASLSGTPAAGSAGTYPLTITAHNTSGSDAVQTLTLTALAAPAGGYPVGWGLNADGVVGDGLSESQRVPVQALNMSGVTAVASGGDSSVVLRGDGTVWTWGQNSSGQLGDNTTTQRTAPVQVLGPGATGFLTGVTRVAAGSVHSLAVKSDGTVWAWGFNSSGQLGDNTVTTRSTPVQVVGVGASGALSGIAAVAGGAANSVALTSGGAVVTWGQGGSGQLGNNTTTTSNVP